MNRITSIFFKICSIFIVITLFSQFSINIDASYREINEYTTHNNSKLSFPISLTWGIGWGSQNIDRAEDIWADQDAIFVCGSYEANTTDSKMILNLVIPKASKP